MIYSITGKIHKIDSLRVILGHGNVMYEVISPSALKLNRGDVATLFTYLSIKNEQIVLYGFTTEDERELFLKITKLQGIGEKMALRILAALSPKEVLLAVETEDVSTLSKVKGFGKKRAERLIFELKGKLPEIGKDGTYEKSKDTETLRQALLALGLKEEETKRFISEYIKKHGKIQSIEDAIKEIVRSK